VVAGSGVGGYEADPSRVQAGMREMHEIAGQAQDLLRDFRAGIAATRGWTGEGDSFAKQITPKVTDEDDWSERTMVAFEEAISSAAEATAGNVASIRSHQDGVLDSIRQARQSDGGGRH